MSEKRQYPTVLTIAGSDSGGGAGLQADMKTMQAFEVFSTCVVVGLTAQNTLGVQGAYPADESVVRAQFESIMADFEIRAAKTGALFDERRVKEVAKNVSRYKIKNLVVDPVMVAKGGAPLLDEDGVRTMKEDLLKRALLVTPNIPEAELLSGMSIGNLEEMKKAASKIQALGVPNVLVKGGHLAGEKVYNFALLGSETFVLTGEKVNTARKHGTGDTLSAAIISLLAKGCSLKSAIIAANDYMNAILPQPLFTGHGHGSLNHGLWKNPEKVRESLTGESLSRQLVIGLGNVQYDEQKLLGLVEEACQAGMTVVQYREKGEKRVDFEKRLEIARKLKGLCAAYGVLLFIDDDVDLAILSKADGVHVGQDDTSVEAIVERAPELLIGLSISTMQELEKSKKDLAQITYIGVGPVYETTTKTDAKPAIGLEGLKAIKNQVKVPVIAIGGINEENAVAVYSAGADGLAVISAITNSDHLIETVKKLIKHGEAT
ncbi:bifunctional hydroxymethylpyrimidine kinase/phosphomethylpyrimidine kinase [Fructobacillus parabroussonetiae]|uniref:Thiamine-phosphate synthase n=1 Tax=Fructobacillus parabroussonetiae TaxID=2713174 RepID=A0ABS5QY16_9LACO|nr:bifunctional hydroxymethylpyrimidine kinase/phosphomethylpyrimidine kinase [Fructobacillus parabroussonetiae]